MALVCAAGFAPPAHEWHQGSLLATRVIAVYSAFQSLIAVEANEGPVLLWLVRFGVPAFQCKPELRWGYPLNLSISVSGGRETNQDSLSKGD